MKESRKPHERVETEIAVLREIASAVARERNVRRLLEDALGILERSMGMLRGTFTLLEGDELRIVASTSGLNAEERALGRYRLGEGITGLVAKTGKAEVVCDVRKDRRFLNRTKSRRSMGPRALVGAVATRRSSTSANPSLMGPPSIWRTSRPPYSWGASDAVSITPPTQR